MISIAHGIHFGDFESFPAFSAPPERLLQLSHPGLRGFEGVAESIDDVCPNRIMLPEFLDIFSGLFDVHFPPPFLLRAISVSQPDKWVMNRMMINPKIPTTTPAANAAITSSLFGFIIIPFVHIV